MALLGKDLRTELRTMRSLPAMVLFAVTTFIIFRYGLDRTTLSGSLAGGVLWTTLLFAGILGINRIFVSELEEGGFDAIRLAPVDRTVLFTSKVAALFIYLAVLQLIVVPVFAVFFLPDWSALGPLVAVDPEQAGFKLPGNRAACRGGLDVHLGRHGPGDRGQDQVPADLAQ